MAKTVLLQGATLHGETWSCFWQNMDDESIIAFDTSSRKNEIVMGAGGWGCLDDPVFHELQSMACWIEHLDMVA